MASPGSDVPVRKRRRAAQIPEEEWQAYQKTILTFYISDGLTLLELMHRMETEWAFHATVKQYKRRLSLWGFLKNVKNHEIRDLVLDDNDGMCTPSGIKVTEAKRKRHLRKMMLTSRLASEQKQTATPVLSPNENIPLPGPSMDDVHHHSDSMSETSTVTSERPRLPSPDIIPLPTPVNSQLPTPVNRQLPTPPQNPGTDCTPTSLELLYDIGPWSLEDSTLSEHRNIVQLLREKVNTSRWSTLHLAILLQLQRALNHQFFSLANTGSPARDGEKRLDPSATWVFANHHLFRLIDVIREFEIDTLSLIISSCILSSPDSLLNDQKSKMRIDRKWIGFTSLTIAKVHRFLGRQPVIETKLRRRLAQCVAYVPDVPDVPENLASVWQAELAPAYLDVRKCLELESVAFEMVDTVVRTIETGLQSVRIYQADHRFIVRGT